MGKPRRKFSREFKLEAVKQVVEQGRRVSEVAEGLDLSAGLLSRWKVQFEKTGEISFPGHGRRAETEAEAEVRRLKRELKIVRKERDILKNSRARVRSLPVGQKLPLRTVECPRRSGRQLIGAQSPLKNMARGWLRTCDW